MIWKVGAWKNREQSKRIWLRWVFFASFMFCVMTGCGTPNPVVTEYGKVTGDQGGTSLNGTGIFYGMFREGNFSVRRASKISPRMNRYNTVVWFPNDYTCPSERVTEWFDEWLSDGSSRTLIYVGRDYTADVSFFEQLLKTANTSGDEIQKEKVLRSLAEAKLEQDLINRQFIADENKSCPWFKLKTGPRRVVKKVTGRLAVGLDNEPALQTSTRVVPDDDRRGADTDTLLLADKKPFVIALTNDSMGRDNKIIIVNNGSFLLNYGLVNRGNRELAGKLIDQCDRYSGVVFLETGAAGAKISDSDANNHNSWSWIGKPPLRYIAPHFLLWGILFCFVMFPIFGRPRKRVRKPDGSNSATNNTAFRSHIAAMGKLLQRTKQRDRAIQKVEKHQEQHSHDPRSS